MNVKNQSVNICYTYVDIQDFYMSSYWPVFLNVLGAGSVTTPVWGHLERKGLGKE